jgi:hypothetical protein
MMASVSACLPVPYTGPVDAAPLLAEIGRRLREVKLDAVLIGNAAAALQGAPVTTVDFDFLFRKTPRNLTRLKALARALRATILRPYYPVSDLYRSVRDDDGLQLDFMATIHGLRSYEGVRDRAAVIEVGGVPVRVASLADIIKSKRAAGLAIWPCWMSWRPPLKKAPSRRVRLAALARESRRDLVERVRRWQALPPSRRTNFLRKRVSYRATSL